MNNSALQETLKSYFPALDKGEINTIVKHSSYLKSPKGTKLISEGERHKYFYLLLKGGVKAYFFKNTKKVCMWFSFENEMIGTISMLQGDASKETIELLEDSELIKFNTEKMEELSQTCFSLKTIRDNLLKEDIKWFEERVRQSQFTNSNERYEALIKHTPEILQRVSLTDIASYIGISRETLSRIRSRK